jgi:hypothetical protein
LRVLPPRLAPADVHELVNSLLSNQRKLERCEPWLFEDVIQPLLKAGRADVGELCRLWLRELLSYFEDPPGGHTGPFRREAEGRVTETAAYLFSVSSVGQQEDALTKVSRALGKHAEPCSGPWRVPSTGDRSQVVALWIFAFARWAQHFLAELGKTNSGLKELSTEAQRVALTRPLAEWRAGGS